MSLTVSYEENTNDTANLQDVNLISQYKTTLA